MVNSASLPTTPADVRWMNLSALAVSAIGVVVLLAAAVVWLAQASMFTLSGITVDGEVTHNNPLTLRANAMPKLAGNFFSVDLGAAQKAFESVPWVRQAAVRRVWPNQLAVQLEEHQTVALWATSPNDDTEKLVNHFGEVFEANVGDVEDQGLPTLRGPEGTSAQVLTMYVALARELAPLQSKLEVLELSGRGSWRAELENGCELEIGRGSVNEVLERTRRFVNTLPEAIRTYPEHPLLRADLRHNQGYALRLKGVSTTASAPAASPQK
jgi:cell division protein FtsQ